MNEGLPQVREAIARGDYGEARRVALLALAGPVDEETRARLTHNLALATQKAGDNLEALRILDEGARLFETACALVKGNYHNELGNVLCNLGFTARAVIEYRKALECYRQAGREAYRASVYNNLSLALRDAGRFREAIQCSTTARRILAHAQDARILADTLDSYDAIIKARAAAQSEASAERPAAHTVAREPQSTRAP